MFAEQRHFGATANVFTFRRIVDEVGQFDATLKSHGDRVWGQQIHAAGYTVRYADDARVSHPVRATLSDLLKRESRFAGGAYDLTPPTFRAHSRWIIRVLTTPIRAIPWYLKLTRFTIVQRLQVIGVACLVSFTKVIERTRLMLGGTTWR